MIPGELYWVEFPASGGHEQAGLRPALFLQDEAYAGRLSMVFVIPISSQLANLQYAATVRADPSQVNGLYKPSVILVYQARAIDRRRIRNRIGVIEPSILAQVYSALDQLTGHP